MMPPLRLATRTLLISFLPLCLTLAGGFFAIRAVVEERVKSEKRESLERAGEAAERIRSKYDQRNRHLVSILSENAGLKAGIGLLRESPARQQIQRTIADQLREMAGAIDYDLLLVSDMEGNAVAVLLHDKESVRALDPEQVPTAASPLAVGPSLIEVEGTLYDVTTVPVNLGAENLGSLTVGRLFDLSAPGYAGHAALLRNGKIVISTLPATAFLSLEEGLRRRQPGPGEECEVTLQGETFLAVSLQRAGFGKEYRLVTLHSIDAATKRFVSDVRQVFTLAGACALVAVLLLSALGSRSVARPLTALVSRLKESERTGRLPEDFPINSGTREVNQLAQAFNQAAAAISESQERLNQAYVQFMETMAQALDARDPYTAGHSQRVSEYATAIARAMKLPPAQVEVIRIAARFHDIGKIGVPDSVLQKPGRLTDEEYELIKQHPVIGKRILEKVGQFENLLPTVELHHEDQDGSGYPYGLRGDEIPLFARIVKVADAYDAMTSNRAYRKAMSRQRVIDEMTRCSGTQFDPEVIRVFLSILPEVHPEPVQEYANACV